MKLTILCLTYNHAPYIENALRGFVNQVTDHAFQVFVLDDASTDGTSEIVADYASRYPSLIKHFKREKNLGITENGREGFDRIDTPYFGYCEGDDFWCNIHFVQKAVSFMDAHPDCPVFSGNTLHNDIPSGRQYLRFAKRESGWFGVEEGNHAHVSASVVRYRKRLPMLDTFLLQYLASLGPCYYQNELFSVYTLTGQGAWSGASRADQQKKAAVGGYLLNKLLDYKYDDIFSRMIMPKGRVRRRWWIVKKIMGPKKFWDFYFRLKKYPLDAKMDWFNDGP